MNGTPAIETTLKRRCYVCKAEKPLKSFIKNKPSPFGRGYRCHTCAGRAHRARWTPEERARKNKRANPCKRNPNYKAPRTAAKLACEKRYRVKNKNKNRVHVAVRRAIVAGTLVRCPCEVCGSQRSVAHHDDYNQPLNVRWLCPPHHKEWHRENGEAANSQDEVNCG